MTRIADLLAQDCSGHVDETVKIDRNDSARAVAELGEYVTTDQIRAEYERLFPAMVEAVKTGQSIFGVWISGFYGSGKTSFAKNMGAVLANTEISDDSLSTIFLRQMSSQSLADSVEFLHRVAPCEVVPLKMPEEIGAETDFFKNVFDAVEDLRPGRTLVFLLDEIGERLENLRAVVGELEKVSGKRREAGMIPGPIWIVVTSEKQPHEWREYFPHQINLSRVGMRQVVAQRILRKKEGHEHILRAIFREHGARLIQNVRIEGSSRKTEFGEDEFVEFYPYLPHLINLSIDIAAGIREHPDAPKRLNGTNLTIVKQCFEMLVSDRTRLADEEVGMLVRIDQIYDLVEGSIPPERQHDVFVIADRCPDAGYPGMAARVAKAICLMEYAKTDLPRTAKNIAALLIPSVDEDPPRLPVSTVLEQMRRAQFARETNDGWTLFEHNFDELLRSAGTPSSLQNAIGKINPRPPGLRNELIQAAKKMVARILTWYLRPVREFSLSAGRSIEGIVGELDHITDLPLDVACLQDRLAKAESRNAALERQLELLHEQVRLYLDKNPTGTEAEWGKPRPYVPPNPRKKKTAYIVGLFGTGRQYLGGLIMQKGGERAKYFRDTIRLHVGPTPMIYSGHATIKYVSRSQNLPAVTSRILEAVKAGFANLIFIYRHPLDSLLTNWIWWRTYIRDCQCISGITQVYRNREDLWADLDENFAEFETFARGDPDFFRNAEPGPRFLSLSEFIEETELYLDSPATLTLRFEDFMDDPNKQFSKLTEVMSIDFDASRSHVAPPRTKAYGFLDIREKVPRFKNFIDGLSAESKRRMDKIGYCLGS